MKKTMSVVMVLLLTTIHVFAQDYTVAFKNGLSLDGSYIFGNGRDGAQIDFGFGLYEKENTPTRFTYLRNHITFEGGFLSSNGFYGEVGDNLIYGNHFTLTDEFAIRAHGLLGFGFSLFADDDQKTDWTKGFIISPRLGFGTEFVFVDNTNLQGSFFIEMLGNLDLVVGDGKVTTLHEKYSSFEDTLVTMRMGTRIYF